MREVEVRFVCQTVHESCTYDCTDHDIDKQVVKYGRVSSFSFEDPLQDVESQKEGTDKKKAVPAKLKRTEMQ
jgi:hypothetical protein